MRSVTLTALLTAAAAPASSQIPREDLAFSEMIELRDAMQRVAIAGNYYTTIENLDDRLDSDANPDFQNINDEGGAIIVPLDDAMPVRRGLNGAFPPNTRTWEGPFMNFPINRWEPATGDYDEGTLLDRLDTGEPYYLYGPLGLIDPEAPDFLSLDGYGDDFVAWAVVSYGFDTVPRTVDDIIVEFGPVPTSAVISSAVFQPGAKSSGPVLTVRGYNLGSIAGSGAVLVDGIETGQILDWSPVEVTVRVGALTEGQSVSVRTDSGVLTRSVAAAPLQTETAVGNWLLF